MAFLLLVPTLLSLLVFCAHLLRNGLLIAVPLVLASPLLLFVRHGLVARLFQLGLVFIAVNWVLAAVLIADERIEAGRAWVRMAVILGGVALFALLAAALFETPRLQRRYPRSF